MNGPTTPPELGLFVLGSSVEIDGGVMDAPPELVEVFANSAGRRFPVLFFRMPISEGGDESPVATSEARFMFIAPEGLEKLLRAIDTMMAALEPGAQLQKVSLYDHEPIKEH